MFGISFSEIILIFVIALLVLGPQQLPQIASKVGRLIFTMRNFMLHLKQDIYQQTGFNELTNARDGIINGYQQIKKDIFSTGSINYIHPEIFTNDEFYQPELDFDAQPELF
jgi:sec-independent protein translocase protein TatB